MSRPDRAGCPAVSGPFSWCRDGPGADTSGMAERGARLTVAGCVAVTFAVAVGAFVLARDLTGGPGVGNVAVSPRDMMLPVVYVLTGAALVWLRARNAVGWIMTCSGLCVVWSTFLGVYGVYLYTGPDGGLLAGQILLALASWLWLPGLFLLPTLLPLLYPTGHLPSPRWRLAVISTATGLALLAPVMAFSVDSVNDWHEEAQPLWVLPSSVEIVLAVIGFGLLVVTSVACIGNAVWRTWRAEAPERAQLAWLLTTTTAAAVLAFVAPAEWMFTAAVAAVPVAIAVGVLRYGLLGIQVVLHPTLL